MKSRLYRFGFEIEGEFSTRANTWLQGMGLMRGDGSVRTCVHNYQNGMKYHEKWGTNYQTAEFNSVVYDFKPVDIERAKKLFEDLQKLSDEGHYHWNASAGFHIHTSYIPIKPPEIMSLEFVQQFLAALKNKFHDAYQLRKDNRYCATETSDDEIAYDRGIRYKAVNIQGALAKHGTIEFRIFPADSPAKMMEYLTFTLEFIDNFLENCAITRKIEDVLQFHTAEESAQEAIRNEPIIDGKMVQYKDAKTKKMHERVERVNITNAPDVTDIPPDSMRRLSMKSGKKLMMPEKSETMMRRLRSLLPTKTLAGVTITAPVNQETGEWIPVCPPDIAVQHDMVLNGRAIFTSPDPFRLETSGVNGGAEDSVCGRCGEEDCHICIECGHPDCACSCE